MDSAPEDDTREFWPIQLELQRKRRIDRNELQSPTSSTKAQDGSPMSNDTESEDDKPAEKKQRPLRRFPSSSSIYSRDTDESSSSMFEDYSPPRRNSFIIRSTGDMPLHKALRKIEDVLLEKRSYWTFYWKEFQEDEKMEGMKETSDSSGG